MCGCVCVCARVLCEYMKWRCSHSCFRYYPTVAVVVGCAADYKTLHERARTSCQPWNMKFCSFLSFIDFEFAVSSPPFNFAHRSCCEWLLPLCCYLTAPVNTKFSLTHICMYMHTCVCMYGMYAHDLYAFYLLLMSVAIIATVVVIIVNVVIERHCELPHQRWQHWSVKQQFYIQSLMATLLKSLHTYVCMFICTYVCVRNTLAIWFSSLSSFAPSIRAACWACSAVAQHRAACFVYDFLLAHIAIAYIRCLSIFTCLYVCSQSLVIVR